MTKAKINITSWGEIYTDESALQRSCVRWFRTLYSSIGEYLFSIPNGGKLGGKTNRAGFPIQAAIMVGEGLTSGVADLFLAMPRSGLHGLFLETKTPVGEWAEDQQEFAKRQIAEGYGYMVFFSQMEFERIIFAYLQGKFIQPSFDEIKQAKKTRRRSPWATF